MFRGFRGTLAIYDGSKNTGSVEPVVDAAFSYQWRRRVTYTGGADAPRASNMKGDAAKRRRERLGREAAPGAPRRRPNSWRGTPTRCQGDTGPSR